MEIPLWFSNVIFWSIQVALLVLAAALLTRVLKLLEPRVLLACWRSLLAISLLLPLVQPWHRPQNIAPIVFATEFVGFPLPPPSAPVDTRWHLPSLQTIAPFLGMVILAGMILRFAILALGLFKLRRLRQASRPIASSSECAAVLHAMRALVLAPADFRLSAQVDSPVTFGFLAPVVLLPERFASLDPRFQSVIACHEFLHIRRHDWAQHLGEEVLRALFWFHPAIAWLVSRVRLAREQVVDLEVVRLTNARKPYLEALLEFTSGRASLAAVPAPPFLAERQLVERVALMLKEVRMSRRRRIASLTLISCCLGLVITLAARTFPLKAAPRPARSALRNSSQQNADAAPPLFERIEVKHHDFGAADLNDGVVNAEQARLNQLPARLTAGTTYDQATADAIRKGLEDFWSERGVTMEVRFTLAPSSRSARHVVLQFDVYKQTLVPGKLEGGIAGGVSGGIAQGISRGIAEGIPKGIAEGISRGIAGATVSHASQDEPSVDISTIWTFTAKRGPMFRQVRGLGTLSRAEGSENSVVKLTLPAVMAADVRGNQNATVDTHKGLVKGHIIGVSPGSSDETRTVNIAIDGPLPQGFWVGSGARNVAEVVATIEIARLENVLYIGRPVNGAQNATLDLFKIINNGAEAVRTHVKLGRASVNTIEILDGLKEGDKVILSDMSSVAHADRIRLTDEKHVVSH